MRTTISIDDELPRHDAYRGWVEETTGGVERFAIAGVVLSGFVRIAPPPGLVANAYIAALAIRHGCELATEDGDLKRFLPRLSIKRPLGD